LPQPKACHDRRLRSVLVGAPGAPPGVAIWEHHGIGRSLSNGCWGQSRGGNCPNASDRLPVAGRWHDKSEPQRTQSRDAPRLAPSCIRQQPRFQPVTERQRLHLLPAHRRRRQRNTLASGCRDPHPPESDRPRPFLPTHALPTANAPPTLPAGRCTSDRGVPRVRNMAPRWTSRRPAQRRSSARPSNPDCCGPGGIRRGRGQRGSWCHGRHVRGFRDVRPDPSGNPARGAASRIPPRPMLPHSQPPVPAPSWSSGRGHHPPPRAARPFAQRQTAR